jgi:DNA repair exonuclease SbcCD ATPase subunit
MLENENGRFEERDDTRASNRTGWTAWLAAAVALLGIVALTAAVYARRQQTAANSLAARNAEMSSTMNGMQDQISALTSKLNDLTAAQAAATQAAQAQEQAAAAKKAAASTSPRRQSSAESRRLKQMQTQLNDQAKQLKDTQDALAQARTDIEGNINSTRDQLSGSIARTHEELVVLEQRGERNYFEFDLLKSKSFQRTGPISVSLRKADTKHRSYDLTLLVDDNQLAKHNVDLYEPIWITGDESRQLQIVVNKIDKNHVHGYVSAPKYPQARVVATSMPASGSSSTSAAPAPPANPQNNNPETASPQDQNRLQPSPQ